MPATATGANSTESEELALTEKEKNNSTMGKSERERENETVDIGLDTPPHERTPMAEDGKAGGKKPKPPLDSNIYSTKKTVAQGMMDLALLTANASQLKMILKYSDQRGELFAAHVACLSLSIILQIIVGIMLIMKTRYDINRESHQSRADRMNNLVVIGVFLITVLNVLASSFDEGRPASPYDPDRITSTFNVNPVVPRIDLGEIAPAVDDG